MILMSKQVNYSLKCGLAIKNIYRGYDSRGDYKLKNKNSPF